MEKLKNVHDHKFTDLIKVCIFALMLILPGIIFLPSCLYYGFNEHATNTETTTINYKYQSNEVNTLDDLVVGNIYQFNANNEYTDDLISNANLEFDILKIYQYNFLDLAPSENETNWVSILEDSDISIKMYIDTYSYNGNLIIYFNDDELTLNYDLDFNEMFSLNAIVKLTLLEKHDINDIRYYHGFSYTDYNVIESVSVNTDDTISNKLYNSWEQMWNTPLFSWTNNTPFNNSLNGFIGIFGINAQSYISNVLIWLLSMTAIYVVIDIVIGVFKWLTHLIGAR